ncbi:unnamed protein product [Euphydryas editha]|uniref:Uncharacterized protein n=1 Tax=Euphydryas editha TaxID=104508 RepID=A0AAU9TUR5_EUPED|nr:unnamed protein product [Euphydryas editha]
MAYINLFTPPDTGYASSVLISTNNSHPDINKNENFSNINNVTGNRQSQINESIFDHFYGNQTNFDDEQDYLDLSTVDIETAKKLLERAQKNYDANFNGTEEKPIGRNQNRPDETYFSVPFFTKKAFDLMKQSVYSTRYRLEDTRELRKRFANDFCYNIAIFYGSLMQLRIKMDNVFATMMKFPYAVKFIWYLGLYERSVAINVDVTYMVEAMFKMHAHHRTVAFGESVEKGGD